MKSNLSPSYPIRVATMSLCGFAALVPMATAVPTISYNTGSLGKLADGASTAGVVVDQPGAMDMTEPASGLEIDVEPAPPMARLAAPQFAERTTVDELHRDVCLAVVRSDLVDGHQVRVTDPGERLGLAEEPPFRDVRVQDLDRHLAF